MNLNIVTNAIKTFFVAILNNLIPILFLLGLGVIVAAVFLFNFILGLIALGIALIVVALILANEQSKPT